jgi:hypothetical protein
MFARRPDHLGRPNNPARLMLPIRQQGVDRNDVSRHFDEFTVGTLCSANKTDAGLLGAKPNLP